MIAIVEELTAHRPRDRWVTEAKCRELETVMAVAADHGVGQALIDWAHDRIDEVLKVVASAVTPFEGEESVGGGR